MTLGGLFRKRREALGRTQEEVATEVGLTRNTIQRFETGKFPIRSNNLLKLLKVLRGTLKIDWND